MSLLFLYLLIGLVISSLNQYYNPLKDDELGWAVAMMFLWPIAVLLFWFSYIGSKSK